MHMQHKSLGYLYTVPAFIGLIILLVIGERVEYIITVATFIGISVIAALGQNVITGYAGQMMLGYAGLMGVASYSTAILTTSMGFSFWLTLPIAIVLVSTLGFLVGWLAIRVIEDHFAIVTIGLNFIIHTIFLWSPFFGMSAGIQNVPSQSLFSFKPIPSMFFIVWATVIVLAILDVKLVKSRLGIALRSIGQDQISAQSAGISPLKYKLIALTIGSSYAGAAGVFMAHFLGYVHADFYEILASFEIFTLPIVGGIGTTQGPIVGASLLGGLVQASRELGQIRWLIFGSITILIMLFQPQGIVGRNSFILRSLRRISGRRGTSVIGSSPMPGLRIFESLSIDLRLWIKGKISLS